MGTCLPTASNSWSTNTRIKSDTDTWLLCKKGFSFFFFFFLPQRSGRLVGWDCCDVVLECMMLSDCGIFHPPPFQNAEHSPVIKIILICLFNRTIMSFWVHSWQEINSLRKIHQYTSLFQSVMDDFFYLQFTSSACLRLWEGNQSTWRNPHRYSENMKTPHRKDT